MNKIDTEREFDRYHKKINEAMLKLPYREMWKEAQREEVLSIVKKCLPFEDSMIPEIKTTLVKTLEYEQYDLDFLTFESWENVFGTAHLYKPKNKKKAPVVLLCCGHGAGCKLGVGYQAMARRLAVQGAYVLVADNIGQGEREFMGHKNSVVPFACGLSVQGLIVAETIGLVNWISNSEFAEKDKIAAIGNSGGGTLGLFLGALCPQISVLSSSGYPSTFEWIAGKEKKHCHCNIIPGILGKAEMDMILSLFAPRDLFIFQGKNDEFFPEDLFYEVSRKVARVYREMGCEDKFVYKVYNGTHPWNVERRYELGNYLAEKLGLDPVTELEDDTAGLLSKEDVCVASPPKNAKTIDDLAEALTNQKYQRDISLWQVFAPEIEGDGENISGTRGSVLQVFAQYEAFLGK